MKEVILTNEELILTQAGEIVPREGITFQKELRKVNILYGVRRSGKTYILFDIFRKNKDGSMYIDFEDERLINFETEDFARLIDIFYELKPEQIDKEVVFLFDEVQNIPGWEKFCRRMVEKENAKVYVAGSSSELMPREIHTSLRGRAWSIEAFPFSFREFLSSKDLDLNDKKLIYGRKKNLTKNYFKEYLNWGGFPEVSILSSDFERKKILKEYMGALYFKDLVEKYKISNITLLETLWEKIFSSFSTKVSLKAFYRQFKDEFPFSKETLYSYYNHLLESWLIFKVEKFSKSEYVRKRNPNKVYLIDTGLSRRVSSQDKGRLLENLVFLKYRRNGTEVFYFQEERECDFIVKENGGITICQVTWELNERNREREIKGAIEACKYLNLDRCKIITFDYEDKLEVDEIKIEVIPIWKWLLESG